MHKLVSISSFPHDQTGLSGANIDNGGQYVLLMAQWLQSPGSGANGTEPYIYYSDVSSDDMTFVLPVLLLSLSPILI